MGFLKFDEVWDRTGQSEMDATNFGLMTMLFFVIGTVSVFASSYFFRNISLENGWILFGVVMLVLATGVAGVIIAKQSSDPLVSMGGFMLITIPYGTLLGPFMMQYSAFDIVTALILSLVFVAALGFIGYSLPQSLEGWLETLTTLLWTALVAYLVLGLAVSAFGWNPAIMDYLDVLVIILFAFIIMYDFNRAKRLPYTLDNAIDVAIAIYLDFINVFIRILRLRSGSGSKN